MAGTNTLEIYKKYLDKPREWKKLRIKLENNWGLLYDADNTRGFYYSFESKLTFENLMDKIRHTQQGQTKSDINKAKAKKIKESW